MFDRNTAIFREQCIYHICAISVQMSLK